MDDAERDLQATMLTLRNAGLDPTILTTLTYGELVAHLETPPIFNGVSACLQALLPLAQQRNPAIPPPLVAVPFNVKVFMVAFHVSYRSDAVFEAMTDLATALKAAADAMVATVFRVHDRLAAGAPLPTELTAAFLVDLDAYHRAFLAWKRVDEQRVVQQIRARLQALVDTPAPAIAGQVADLETMLTRVAGQAALDEFNAAMAENGYPLL